MSKCPHCGNNPVPHGLYRFHTSVLISLGVMDRFFLASRLGRFLFYGMDAVFSPAFRLLKAVGAVHTSDRMSPRISDRARVLWEEAGRRGIRMEHVLVFGREADHFRAVLNGREVHFTGLPMPRGTGATAGDMDDKARLKTLCETHGIPAPRGGCFTRFSPLLQRFHTLEKPVILKPRIGSRGRHTTTFVSTEAELLQAFRIAKQLCPWVILEEHLTGSVYRGTLIGGKLAGVLRGDPPRVTGDGIHTIAELIELKNAARHPKVHAFAVTPLTLAFLKRSGWGLADVPPAGRMLDLSEKIGVSYGGHSAEVTHLTHPETQVLLERAAAAIGDPYVGLDFITPDISAPPHSQKWGVIECNSVPFINLHHDPVEGPSNNVAGRVWEFIVSQKDSECVHSVQRKSS